MADTKVEAPAEAPKDELPTPLPSTALHEPEYDVEVKQADPNNPLYSIKSFEELGGLYVSSNFSHMYLSF